MRTTTRITITALALLTAVGLAGCSGAKSTSEPTATETVTSSPQPSPTATTTPAPSAPATTGTGGSGSAPSPAGSCASSQLTGTLQRNLQGGSVGHTYLVLLLTNHGASCTLQGWPGTSFVGDSGNQLGAAATFVTSSPHGTVTIPMNGAAKATIAISQAANYGDSCTKTPAKGFRIYPPGQKAALFADGSGFGLTACTQSNLKLLTVTALQ